jgi:hypothetical protein
MRAGEQRDWREGVMLYVAFLATIASVGFASAARWRTALVFTILAIALAVTLRTRRRH